MIAMIVDILCKVVDNYGDIGLVYRLAKGLSDLDPGLSLRLIVDNLAAFHCLCPAIDPERDVQAFRGWTIVRWSRAWEGIRAAPPRLVVESFACGRPDWYEEILFDPADTATRWIINLEHLTPEDFAEDFHKLPSATRSALVKKTFFMPGFTAKTGGLLVDRRFRDALGRWAGAKAADRGRLRRDLAKTAGLAIVPGHEDRFWLCVFSYERDYSRIVADLTAFNAERPLLALVASGRSEACFVAAWEAGGRPFPLLRLPFLPQEAWDEVLLASDFAIVRGEESLARAALAGRPFLWHAYLQEGGYQLVKVRALIDRLRPFFPPTSFEELRTTLLAFNDRLLDGPATRGTEALLPLLVEAETALAPGFAAFSRQLLSNGDLAANLLTFIGEIV